MFNLRDHKKILTLHTGLEQPHSLKLVLDTLENIVAVLLLNSVPSFHNMTLHFCKSQEKTIYEFLIKGAIKVITG